MRYGKWIVLAAAWSAAIGSGLWAMFDYEMTPGKVARLSGRWPRGSALTPDPRRPTLVLFVHPHCPCSRASLNELLVLVTHCGGKIKPLVVFLRPPGFAADWEKTDLWEMADSIPGVERFADVDGTETARFRARVSGETLVYGPDGNLLFHGGITVSRGHQGDNAGRAAIESILVGETAGPCSTPVFGCSLCDDTVAAPQGRRPESR